MLAILYSYVGFGFSDYVVGIVLFLAAASLCLGLLGALSSMRLRSILAYSSILNTGYFLFILVSSNFVVLAGYLFVYILEFYRCVFGGSHY